MYDMRSTNVSLNVDVLPPVEERRLRWTTWPNLFNWFENFKTFLIEFDFAGIDDDGELTFTEEQLRWIKNIDKTELALDGGTHADRRARSGNLRSPPSNCKQVCGKIFTCLHGDIWEQRCR